MSSPSRSTGRRTLSTDAVKSRRQGKHPAFMRAAQTVAQVTGDGGIPDRGVHLGMTAQGKSVQIARADGRPLVVDDHQLGMDIDRYAGKTEAGIAGKRFDPFE